MPDDLLRPTIGADVDLSARPWRLMSQTYVAFFGGVLSATVIALLNARRLGVAVKGQLLILLTGICGFALVVVALELLTGELTSMAEGLPWGSRVAIRAIAVLVCLVQLRIQQPMDRAFQLRGAEYKSLWWPGLAAVFGGLLMEFALLELLESVL